MSPYALTRVCLPRYEPGSELHISPYKRFLAALLGAEASTALVTLTYEMSVGATFRDAGRAIGILKQSEKLELTIYGGVSHTVVY